AVGFGLHAEHQCRDELLAGGGDESVGTASAVFADDSGVVGQWRAHGEGHVWSARLGRASQHDVVARYVSDRWSVASVGLEYGSGLVVESPVGALVVHGRS